MARSYRHDQRLPSQRKSTRDYRTRIDPLADVWADVERLLQGEARLKAKTLFEHLQQRRPGKFDDSGADVRNHSDRAHSRLATQC